MWARLRAATGVGFAGVFLYVLPTSDFHEMTSGNIVGEAAGVGYDLVRGRGSVILSNAIDYIRDVPSKALCH